jgi:hypothetical protein
LLQNLDRLLELVLVEQTDTGAKRAFGLLLIDLPICRTDRQPQNDSNDGQQSGTSNEGVFFAIHSGYSKRELIPMQRT